MIEAPGGFVGEMEQRFGTDEALGVCFRAVDGRMLSLAEYDAMVDAVGVDNMPDCESLFPDGLSATCCTDYAIQIFRELPGRVKIFGFANDDNPMSRVAREQIHLGGHDFALVDDRYIVDPWIRLVAGASDQMVFDLKDIEQALQAVDIYGLSTAWSRMEVAEASALADPGQAAYEPADFEM